MKKSCSLFTLFLITFLFISGCTKHVKHSPNDLPDKNTTYSKLYPSFPSHNQKQSKELQYISTSSVKCSTPYAAKLNPTSGFRYGCFCGSKYPENEHPSGKSIENLSDSERHELAKEYYRTEPIDEVDSACLRHDVCIVYSGKQTIDCNQELIRELEQMEEKFDAEQSGKGFGHISARCWLLSADMGLAFYSPAPEGKSDNKQEEIVDGFSRWGATLGVGWLPAIWRVFVMAPVGFKYPLEGERCFTN